MERHIMKKKRRVYSVEPSDITEATFTRKYVSYLAPAIMQVKKNIPTHHENGHSCESSKKIKHEVDMALALSSQGFAWSSALKSRLQKNTNDIPEENVNGRLLIPNAVYQSMPKSFGKSSEVISKSHASKTRRKEEKGEEESKDNNFENRLEYLRTLIPGGNNMEIEEFFKELRGYIICLDLQVNVLRHLVDSD